jgi:hypothetical protein
MPKLNQLAFFVSSQAFLVPGDSLKMVYYSYFYSVMTYGLVSGGPHYSNIIFREEKTYYNHCRDLYRKKFKKLKILPLQSQYIL